MTLQVTRVASKHALAVTTITTELAATEPVTITLEPEDTERVVRALLGARMFTDPDLSNGSGNRTEFLALSMLLERLGLNVTMYDHGPRVVRDYRCNGAGALMGTTVEESRFTKPPRQTCAECGAEVKGTRQFRTEPWVVAPHDRADGKFAESTEIR